MNALAAPVERLYPLFLRLAGKAVLVVGAGSVGTRKALELVATGAQVHVVAPTASDEVQALSLQNKLVWSARSFEANDIDGMWLVIAATNATEVNREVTAAATAQRIFVNAVDDPPNASAFFASRIEREPFTIAISSSGKLPALSRLLREVLEAALPSEEWITAARKMRATWRRETTPMEARFPDLLSRYIRLRGPALCHLRENACGLSRVQNIPRDGA